MQNKTVEQLAEEIIKKHMRNHYSKLFDDGANVELSISIDMQNNSYEDFIAAMQEFAKQTAIAFAEYTREAPGNMWQRAHGPLLSTEELYDEFIESIKK